MSVHRSRTAHPVTDRPRGLTMGTWGAVLLLVVLSTALAGLAAAGLYLHSGQPAWPPPPLERPGSWLAVLGTLLAGAGAGTATLANLRLRRDERPMPSLLLLVTGVLLTGSLVVLGRDIAGTTFTWSDHAYASVYIVNTAIAALFVAVGLLMVGALLIQRLVGVVDGRRMLEADVTVLYLWWVVPAVAVCLAVAHLLPDPGGGV
jgi:heme/copper-type cytochrome/quinol oxidase subunit 3